MPPSSLSTYRKVRERGSWGFALVSVAMAHRLSGRRAVHARVVLGGVAPVPWRSLAAERALVGRPLDGTTALDAAAAAVEGAEPLEQNAYKIPLLRGVVAEAVLALSSV